MCIQILIYLNQDRKFYDLMFIGWTIVICIIYFKELYRLFKAARVALKPIAAVQDNNNDGTPDWMQYLIDSPCIIIIAICHKLAWIQYKAWINRKISPTNSHYLLICYFKIHRLLYSQYFHYFNSTLYTSKLQRFAQGLIQLFPSFITFGEFILFLNGKKVTI